MELIWVNHASYVFRTEQICLITDPWIEGRVFNNSWCHISRSVFSYQDFDTVSHIWFSHEHPDHFFPPNLKKIPADIRKNITVLFQWTEDKKVVEFCRVLGFKDVVEIKLNQWFDLSNDVTIFSDKVKNDTDSWLAIKCEGKILLNLNDCVFSELDELKRIAGIIGQTDVLLTQFSYANWAGNSTDLEAKKLMALEKQEEMKRQMEIFKPEFTIPFASYVWFCAENNFHMNNEVNRIDEVANMIVKRDSVPIVMYPGDRWVPGEPYDSFQSIQKYLVDFEEILIHPDLTKFNKCESAELKKASETYRLRGLSKNNKRKLYSYRPFSAYLEDLQIAITFSFRDGFNFSDLPRDKADIIFASQNLKYCFDHEWGWDTIMIAGTYEKSTHGNWKNIQEYQWISILNNKGKRMDGAVIRLLRKLKLLK